MKKTVLLISIFFCSIIAISQTNSNRDESKFNFGFNLGANYSNLQAKEALPDDADISNGLGFSLGVFMEYSISKNFSIAPKSELSIHKSSIEFADYSYEIFPVCLDLMTHLVYKIGNEKVVPYVFAGPSFKVPISKKPEISTDFYTNSVFAIDFGVGLENKMKPFSLSPELKYSLGLNNVNQHPRLQTLMFHNISLLLNIK